MSQWQPRVSRQHLALDEDMHAASAGQVLQALGCAPWMAESNAEAGAGGGLSARFLQCWIVYFVTSDASRCGLPDSQPLCSRTFPELRPAVELRGSGRARFLVSPGESDQERRARAVLVRLRLGAPLV